MSVEEAKQHLQQLMADRKELAEQLRVTKAKLEGRLPTKVCCHYLLNPHIKWFSHRLYRLYFSLALYTNAVR